MGFFFCFCPCFPLSPLPRYSEGLTCIMSLLTWPLERCCIAGDSILYESLVAEYCLRLLKLFVVELHSKVVWCHHASICPKCMRIIEPICLGYISLLPNWESDNPVFAKSLFVRPFQSYLKNWGCALNCPKKFHHAESKSGCWRCKRTVSQLS